MSREEKNKVRLTVFTPAYNRAHTITRTYKSLCRQSCKEFLWLIVDDGSADGTADLVRQWQKEDCGFEIRYIYKENGGMHTAHNTAYENIDTELNVCIDSDDGLTEFAVEKILKKWDEVKDRGYAGIIGFDRDMNTGEIIGKPFPDGMFETTFSGYYNEGGAGDKKLIYRTDIIKAYPEYPVFEGEKYFSLSYKYLLIDQTYKLAVINEALADVEYQADGSSNTMFSQYLQNPKGFAHWRTIRMKYDVKPVRLIKDCIHYCSSSQMAHIHGYVKKSPKKLLTALCIPFGWALTVYIKRKAGK